MLRRILTESRYLIIIAVLSSLLTSIILLVYGGVTVVSIGIEAITHGAFTITEAKNLAVECIQVIDLFLLATVLYIVAIGLYELFINPNLPVLPWLVVTNLDELKAKLLGVVTVLLAVTFLSSVVTWDSKTNTILALGVAVGLVLFALGYLISLGGKSNHTKKPDEIDAEEKQKVL